jgi:hypothetical protein
MKFCANCNSNFETTVVIRGKSYNLRTRRHCLECIPFKFKKKSGSRNGATGKCIRCYKDSVYVRGPGVWQGVCNTCWTANKRRVMKDQALKYLGGKCEFCGYDRCATALEFHHRNPVEKLFSITFNNYRPFDAEMRKELDKCALCCANCHREIHAGLLVCEEP